MAPIINIVLLQETIGLYPQKTRSTEVPQNNCGIFVPPVFSARGERKIAIKDFQVQTQEEKYRQQDILCYDIMYIMVDAFVIINRKFSALLSTVLVSTCSITR